MGLKWVGTGLSVYVKTLNFLKRGLSVPRDEAERASPISTLDQIPKSVKLYRYSLFSRS